jgi:membrane-associated phospholipid phosphatase
MRNKFFLLFFAFIINISNSFSKSLVEEIGDYFQVIVPSYAFGMSVNEKDYEGMKQFGYSFSATQASVIGLKSIINRERPNGSNNDSFPSGHTAGAFIGAAFIHRRYGIKRAIIPYVLAGFTGYSRVYARKHYWTDVITGAAISSLFTWVFTTNEINNLQVLTTSNSINLNLKTEF